MISSRNKTNENCMHIDLNTCIRDSRAHIQYLSMNLNCWLMRVFISKPLTISRYVFSSGLFVFPNVIGFIPWSNHSPTPSCNVFCLQMMANNWLQSSGPFLNRRPSKRPSKIHTKVFFKRKHFFNCSETIYSHDWV